MKKPWLLILVGVILVALIGVWLYLFFGGDEARQDLYNAFGLDGTELPFPFDTLLPGDSATSTAQYLRQLSLRQTVGYVPLQISSSTPAVVHLAEAGTGHIYKVTVGDGQEERLSNITIPGAKNASFSPDGMYAAITSDEGRSLTIVTLPHGSTTLRSTKLDVSPVSTSFTVDGALLYAVKEGQAVRGYLYNPVDESTTPVFTVPFREATILWGKTAIGPHFAYPKTAEELEGYLYRIDSGVMSRLSISGFGLSAIADDTSVAFTRIQNGLAAAYFFDQKTKSLSPQTTFFIPEKCTFNNSFLICAANADPNNTSLLKEWYRGEISFNDSLWQLSPNFQEGTFLIHFEAVSGRALDAIHLRVVLGEVYFIHKTDSSLWVYSDDSNIENS